MQTLNLSKLDTRKSQVLDLKKDLGLLDQKAEVKLALDYSFSMNSLYRDGTVQDVVEKLMALGLAFDDNGEIDSYIFHDDYKKLNSITTSNLSGYVESNILKHDMGGTDYSPVINRIVKDTIEPKKGLFRSMFDKKGAVLKYPTYVIFITDGDTSNKASVKQAIIDASKHGIFWQFVGIGRDTFSFLETLDDMGGRELDNAGFFSITDISVMPDSLLYRSLLKEFPSWIPQAKRKGMLQ